MKTLISKIKAWFKRVFGCTCPSYTQDKIEIKKDFRKKNNIKTPVVSVSKTPKTKGKRIIAKKVKAK